MWKTASQYTITVVCHSLTCLPLVWDDAWFLKLYYFDLLLSWSIGHQKYFAYSLVLSYPFMLFTCVQCFFGFFSTSCPLVFLKMFSLSFFDEGGCSSGIDGQWHQFTLCISTSFVKLLPLDFVASFPIGFLFLTVSGQLFKRVETQKVAARRHAFCWNKEIRYLH